MPDTLAHGTFHTLLAIRQCGADTKRVFHVVAIIVDIPGPAVHKRRFIIIVAGRAEPPCNPVPIVWSCHDQADTFSRHPLRKAMRLSVTTNCYPQPSRVAGLHIFVYHHLFFILRCMGQYKRTHYLLPKLPCMSMGQMPSVACNTSRDFL